ncbi:MULTISPECIES: heavy metal translocating P-type ATPase [Bradyrhizobium]|jgi:Cd2+/Zn2+-exporting ATPase|uniref:P-type Zn(2+) transporter n=1 Tax=Bradyrhizobium denitrificans TaxID=2734912 RepID=A0ABS5G1M0_9BRAD|nr:MULTISPECIES: heavy metal translocating P-type ATPase [Bradyrhizobium]MBR1135212.1 cadmium-translocating P-type ATPase [Bradyrhizobium denitrificans]MDU1497460.1 heavy metal translocating P-type ATPase [Bradyrhizobium sp.]MDU1547733.1 heavy metal translocating P-type ATPase [Bradyrhizobium sp.]MDU1806607.1 heavy metal translocating P-type ATPase [Bradyrhizobium sp.]MDU2922643.1 heavy metal translocating P-type ATPase [Bradyrhizobium sp.]
MAPAASITTRFRVDGMDCASCATKIENALRRMRGVTEVAVSVTGGTVTVRRDAGGVDADNIRDQISNLGYRVARSDPDRSNAFGDDEGMSASPGSHSHLDAPSDQPWWKSSKADLTIASGTALAVAFAMGKAFPAIEQWAFLLAMMVGLIPIARRAFSAAMAGTPFSIEMLMTIAAVGAVFIGATEEAATVVFLFLIGEMLEGVAASRARASIQSLTKLVPKTARLEEDGQVREVQADSLSVGALIQVRPGDRIPADGVIVSGESSIDEAPVTGESTPIRKGRDDNLFAGTVNGDGLLRVRVSAAAADNTIARVVKLVEEAQESKAPTERFIDRFSRYYTPGVVAVAALVASVPPLLFDGTWSNWIYKALAILLIGCPCALVISVPAAITASLSAGARRGLLLKGGAVLEQIGKITVACFDKTGTLTAGKPEVTDIIGFERSEGEVLRFAATLESGSSHPLANAILAKAAEQQIRLPPASNATAVGGKGVGAMVEGIRIFLGSPKAVAEFAPVTTEQNTRILTLNDEGKTVSLLVMDDRIAGAIAMRDEPRPDARTGLKLLSDAGIRTVMLTGDNRRTATAIGRQLGIDVEAELLPEDKQRIVSQFQKAGWSVAKVGDGINDAPALAAADVGIAMGGGTDVALETADAAVLHGRVSDVAAMVDLSKRTMTNIRQNITVALGLKAIFLVTTIVGITGLWPAILADTGATVLVTMNALRLLRLPNKPASTGKDGN